MTAKNRYPFPPNIKLLSVDNGLGIGDYNPSEFKFGGKRKADTFHTRNI